MCWEKCNNTDKKIEDRRIKSCSNKRSEKSLFLGYDGNIAHLTSWWEKPNIKTGRNIEKLIESISINIYLGLSWDNCLALTKVLWKICHKITISTKSKITTYFKFLWIARIIFDCKYRWIRNSNIRIRDRYGVFSLKRVLMIRLWHEPAHHQECNTKNKKELKKLRRILLHGESYWVKLDETDDSDRHPEKTPSKSLRRKMSYWFIEVMFASSEFIEYLCMEPSFKPNIHCIVDDNERDNKSNHKIIRIHTVLDTQCCCHRCCECWMRRWHTTGWKHQRNTKTTYRQEPYPLSYDRGKPSDSRNKKKVSKKILRYGHRNYFISKIVAL